MKKVIDPVDEEICFSSDELIVSKTDPRGRILYANDVFCRVAEMSTADVIGQPHSIIRHPDMPRSVFKLMWETIGAGREIFAFVKNMSATGKFYWVIAHVTPTFDVAGSITGYHSNRRAPDRGAVDRISALYRELRRTEAAASGSKDGLAAGMAALQQHLEGQGMGYDHFVWTVGGGHV